MTTLTNLTRYSFAALAIAPLAPVIGAMWVARGLQKLNEISVTDRSPSSTNWELDTVACPVL